MPSGSSKNKKSTKCIILLCIVVAGLVNVLLIATFHYRAGQHVERQPINEQPVGDAKTASQQEHGGSPTHHNPEAVLAASDSGTDDPQLAQALREHHSNKEESSGLDEFAERLVRIENLLDVRLRISQREAKQMTTSLRNKLTKLPINEETPSKLEKLTALKLVKDLDAGTTRSKKKDATAAEGFTTEEDVDAFYKFKNMWRTTSTMQMEPQCVLKYKRLPTIDGSSGKHKDVGVTYTVIKPKNPIAIDEHGHAPYTAIALLFHGCGHTSRDFCHNTDKQGTCHGCLGLPEERAAVADALSLGMVAVAVSSNTIGTSCWKQKGFFVRKDKKDTSTVANSDLWNILSVLKEEGMLMNSKNRDLNNVASLSLLPFILMGASSGGSVLRQVAKSLGPRVVGIIPQIAVPALHDVVDYDLVAPPRPAKSTTAGGDETILTRPFKATVLYNVMTRDATLNGAKAQVRKMLHPKPRPPHQLPQASDEDGAPPSDDGGDSAEGSEQPPQHEDGGAGIPLRPLVAQLTEDTTKWSPLCQAVLDEPHMSKLKVGGELSGNLRSRTHVIALEPVPITPAFFSNRIGESLLPTSTSRNIKDALQEGGFLRDSKHGDPKMHMLDRDPRKSKWRNEVKKGLEKTPDDGEGSNGGHHFSDSLTADKSPIAETMNVAYGRHEFFSDHLLTLFGYSLCVAAESE